MRRARAAEGIRFIGPLMNAISFVSKFYFNYFQRSVANALPLWRASPDALRPAGCVGIRRYSDQVPSDKCISSF
jgi:hypothetical protein